MTSGGPDSHLLTQPRGLFVFSPHSDLPSYCIQSSPHCRASMQAVRAFHPSFADSDLFTHAPDCRLLPLVLCPAIQSLVQDIAFYRTEAEEIQSKIDSLRERDPEDKHALSKLVSCPQDPCQLSPS